MEINKYTKIPRTVHSAYMTYRLPLTAGGYRRLNPVSDGKRVADKPRQMMGFGTPNIQIDARRHSTFRPPTRRTKCVPIRFSAVGNNVSHCPNGAEIK